MSDHYFPFDFGPWRSDEGVTCPRHGIHHGGLKVKVTPTKGGPSVVRQICGLCIIDVIDAFILSSMKD